MWPPCPNKAWYTKDSATTRLSSRISWYPGFENSHLLLSESASECIISSKVTSYTETKTAACPFPCSPIATFCWKHQLSSVQLLLKGSTQTFGPYPPRLQSLTLLDEPRLPCVYQTHSWEEMINQVSHPCRSSLRKCLLWPILWS